MLTLVGTYPPIRCGIATFNRDLREALLREGVPSQVAVVAHPEEVALPFPQEVVRVVAKEDREGYRALARLLRGPVILQHEYGLYGGKWGDYVLDLLEAQNRAQEARKNLDQAQRALESAQAQLANLVGPWEPEPVADLPGLPEAGLVEALLEENADLLQLRHSLALLKAQRALLDESFAARKDIDALEDQIAALATQLDGAASSLRVGLEARFRGLPPLLEGVRRAEEALEAAKKRYEAERARFAAGLASRLALLQQELNLLQAELALEQAKHAYLKAYYGLLATR